MPYTIRIPHWHPTRLNTLLASHWAKAQKLKNKDREQLSFFGCFKAGVPQATGKRRVKLTILLKPRQRAADPDAYWKSLLDGMTRCKLLVDDNRQHCELLPVEFERGTADDWGTIIELTDIEEGRAVA